MTIINKNNCTFRIDIEKTKDYYTSNSICTCSECRNLYAQITALSDSLRLFLSEFGVDICRPDEVAAVEMDNYIDYLFVGYTAIGAVEFNDVYETDIEGFHIKISTGDSPFDWFPNEQKEPCLFVAVTGISLPWVLEEPFPRAQRFFDKIKCFFQKRTQ